MTFRATSKNAALGKPLEAHADPAMVVRTVCQNKYSYTSFTKQKQHPGRQGQAGPSRSIVCMYKYKAGCRLYSIHKNEGGQKSNVQKKAYLGISSLIVSTPDDKDYKFTARVQIYRHYE